MKLSTWLAAAFGFVFLAVLTNPQAAERDKDKDKEKDKEKNPPQEQKAGRKGPRDNRPAQPDQNPDKEPNKQPKPPGPQLTTTPTAKGGSETKTPSGKVREKVEKGPDGSTQTEHFAPATKRLQTKEVQKPDGTHQTTRYATDGKKVTQEVVVNRDHSKQTTSVHYDRQGEQRARETIKVDARGKEVSKTVEVHKTTVIVKNTTINKTIVRNYDRGRYGFVYRPIYVVHSPVFVSWYDPYWYTPAGVVIVHPFRYSWGWNDDWYRYHSHYWVNYEVYPTPAYWVTDWLIAGYVADRYAASVSVAQAQEDLRNAQADARNARLVADQATDAAERAEARLAQHEAEDRQRKAEAQEAKARAQTSAVKPNATPIDNATKETLKVQIEQAIAEKKEIAEQAAKGNAIIPDLSKTLADANHIYPVSKSISVTLADGNPAGNLTEGDLVKLESGQEQTLKESNENTLVKMRVMTSKGEDGEVKAGSVISVSLKDLQDFDSEFRAKLDLGLAEADKNKDQFKSGGK